MIFGWGAKKKKEKEAYEAGRRWAETGTKALDEAMEVRFGPVAENFLEILRDRIETAFDSQDAPPLTVARIEYSIFIENVTEALPKMTAEITERLPQFIELADELDVRELTDELIQSRVAEFETNLTMTGLEFLLEHVDRLKEADNQWRAKNPEKAAEFPPEEE